MNKIDIIDIQDIQIETTENINVFNIELESNDIHDDLYFVDFLSKIYIHNCLRKDFGMINENFPQTDLILQAYKINEFMPKFYVDLVNDKIYNKTIGILGYTMKSDTDDMRDSLVPKMIRYINKLVPKEVLINDCILSNGTINNVYDNHIFINNTIDEVITKSDLIFVAMNHSKYYDLDLFESCSNKIIVDIWGIFNKNLVNYL